MGTGAKRSALDLGGGLGSDGWRRIAPWRRALSADACAAQAARIAQGLQLATDPRLPSTGVPETALSQILSDDRERSAGLGIMRLRRRTVRRV
jgi:hypothetical protein